MNVALFFDGSNFWIGKESAKVGDIDYWKLAMWLVDQAGGKILSGAHYYASIDEEYSPTFFSTFLDLLEGQPGFFVHRFKYGVATQTCRKCGDSRQARVEKRVDTTIAVDMLRLAAVNAFDAVVLLSGDLDFAPAIDGVHSLGKRAYVATWGKTSLSRDLRRIAFDHIDLLDGQSEFAKTTRTAS